MLRQKSSFCFVLVSNAMYFCVWSLIIVMIKLETRSGGKGKGWGKNEWVDGIRHEYLF